MLELFHVFNLVIPGCLGDQGVSRLPCRAHRSVSREFYADI